MTEAERAISDAIVDLINATDDPEADVLLMSVPAYHALCDESQTEPGNRIENFTTHRGTFAVAVSKWLPLDRVMVCSKEMARQIEEAGEALCHDGR